MQIGKVCYPIEAPSGSYEIDAMNDATVGTKEADTEDYLGADSFG